MKKIISIFLSASIVLGMTALPAFAEEEEHGGGCIPRDRNTIQSEELFTYNTYDVIPSVVDMTDQFPKPGNQGTQGSCVGWAVAYACKSYQEALDHEWSFDTTLHLFSPAYIYNQIHLPNDGGAYTDEAMNLVLNQGVCSLADMPYRASNYTAQPTQAQRDAAYPHRSKAYADGSGYRVITTAEGIKHALANGEAVVLDGVPIYNDLDNLRASNPIYNVTGKVTDRDFRGYHDLCAVGYDDSKQAFKFINSWGTSWGLSGYGYIAYDLIEQEEILGYVMQDLEENTFQPYNVNWSYANDKYTLSWNARSSAETIEIMVNDTLIETSHRSYSFLDNGDTKPKQYNVKLRSKSSGGVYSDWAEANVKIQLYGDLSGDGRIGSDDATQILRYINGNISFTEEQKLLADVNNDKKITQEDANMVLNLIAGNIEKFPTGKIAYIHSRDNFANTSNIDIKSYGDITDNKRIDAADATRILRYINGYDTFTEEQKLLADVNGDGKITTADSDMILELVVGHITEFPVGNTAVFI